MSRIKEKSPDIVQIREVGVRKDWTRVKLDGNNKGYVGGTIVII